MKLFYKVKSLIRLLRKIYIYEYSRIFIALKLILCKIHHAVCIFKLLHKVVIEGDISFFYLFIYKHEHIDKRNFVVGKPVDRFGIVLIVNGICSINKLRNFVIYIKKLGKLPRCQLIRKCISVHRLGICKTCHRCNIIFQKYFIDQPLFPVVIT